MNDTEKYCLLAKSTKGMGASSLIMQVVNSKKIYVVGEFLMMDNIQALATSDYAPHFKLLSIFAHGTYQDYQAAIADGAIPAASNEAVTKLRMLTVVSLSHRNRRLHYDLLQQQLGFTDIRKLEDLLIECMYSGLVTGIINQNDRVFEVSSAISRDVFPADIDAMLGKVERWLVGIDQSLAKLKEMSQCADQKTADQIRHSYEVQERGKSRQSVLGALKDEDRDDRKEKIFMKK